LEAVDELEGEYRFGKSAVLLVAPTGSGKTAVGCHFVKQAVDQGKRCLWIAHRSELIRQASQRLAQDYRVRHGIIKAGVGDYDPRFPVQIASVQTLARRKPIDAVGLLIVDEAHHATADTYLRIIESHPDALVLGLTATPWRLAGRQLGSLFDGIIAVANYPYLIEQGYLVRPRVFLPAEVPDFGNVRLLGGEFDEDQAAEIMERPKLVGDVLEQWRKHAASGDRPRSTILFACNVAHSRHLVGAFRQAGIAAEHLDAQVPEKEREAILDRLARGQTTVVSNVMLLSEGFDCPPVSCVVAARPTASRTLFIQMVGRALRPCTATGKKDCIILDHAGNSFRHGLISEITSYDLDQGDFLDPSGVRPICKMCPICNAVVPQNARLCPECQYSFSLARRLPVVVDGELVELARDPAEQPGDTLGSVTPVLFEPASLPQPSLGATSQPGPNSEAIVAELSAPAAAPYQQILLDLAQPGVEQRLTAMRSALLTLAPAEKLAFVKAGLLSGHPDLWLDRMRRARFLKHVGLGCLEKLSGVRLAGYKGLTYFERTKQALRRSIPDLVPRFAALLFAAAVPDLVDRALEQGFKAVRGYAHLSAEVTAEVFEAIGFDGEPRECALELIRHHDYLFEQVLHATASDPIPRLCRRWRKKLGPLWRQHFEFAEALWDGQVVDWIRKNRDAVFQAFDGVEEGICEVKPEEACPLSGDAIIARYKLPPGPWVRVMKDEVGRWCLENPNKAQDLGAVYAAADAIFEHNRGSSPTFNLGLAFLQLDEEDLMKVPDPLGVRPLLVEAARLKAGDVATWAKGYRRKAVVAVIGAVSLASNNKPKASLCAQYFVRLAAALRDLTLGEVLKGLTSARRTPEEVAEVVRKGREGVAALRSRFQKRWTKDLGLNYARALRDVGHFEEAQRVAEIVHRHYPQEPSVERLMESIRKYLKNGNGSAAEAGDR
jgi:superfamily II DNA or RNA helicase